MLRMGLPGTHGVTQSTQREGWWTLQNGGGFGLSPSLLDTVWEP